MAAETKDIMNEIRCAIPKPTKNLHVVENPYPHLRDDEGCVLARDYANPEKLAFILLAVRKSGGS